MSTAREEILGRIRGALRDVPEAETPEEVPVARNYRRVEEASKAEVVEQFAERVAEYRAHVSRVAPGGLREAIGAALAARGARRIVAPADLPAEWVPEGIELIRDPGPSDEQLDRADGILTGCALGIAQTGTIVLDGGVTQGRRALTLLPDYHVCVIRADQIVGLVPEAIERLETAARTPGGVMTWISGPSATSDIELSRVEGVHGPRTLEVLVIEGVGGRQ